MESTAMADTTSLSSSQVVADPDCDLVLLVGPDEVAIEVCSKVLALASPVFAAMFGPHFAEGKALRNPSAYEAPSVSLPEDDAEAMIELCYALHLKLNVNDKNITFELCFTLAKLCDQYNASLALGSWSELWMKSWIDTLKGDERCFKAIYIARAFGNQHAFWSITRDVMLYYNADFVDLPDPGLAKELLPDRLLGKSAYKLQDALD
jgi:DNA-binding transcriptional regulator PaaX